MIQNIKKTIVFSLMVTTTLLLLWCQGTEDQTEKSKKDFLIQTQTVQNIANNINIAKPGKILGSQDIVVSAQVLGRVDDILVKEGDEVKIPYINNQNNESMNDIGIYIYQNKYLTDFGIYNINEKFEGFIPQLLLEFIGNNFPSDVSRYA